MIAFEHEGGCVNHQLWAACRAWVHGCSALWPVYQPSVLVIRASLWQVCCTGHAAVPADWTTRGTQHAMDATLSVGMDPALFAAVDLQPGWQHSGSPGDRVHGQSHARCSSA